MQKAEEKAKEIHKKYPFAEPLFLYLSGIGIGFVLSLLNTEFSARNSVPNWNVLGSSFFWISTICILISIVYYCKFSSYSLGKQPDYNSSVTDSG